MLYNLADIADRAKFNAKCEILKQKGADVELTEKKASRTLRQNAAIHLYCELIAECLNEVGLTFSYTGIKGMKMELRYSKELIKETLWKPIQMALFGKESTTQLNREEVSEIAGQIEHFFASQGIDLPFPSIESL